MKESINQKVEKFILPIVTNLGYTLVAVEFAKKQNGDNLTVFIDKKDGVRLDDCVAVHQAIDAPLDELNPTNNASYILNVSSPGLDRPLKTDADLNNNIGEMLEANLFTKENGKKCFVGKLEGFNEASIILQVNEESITLNRNNISKINKYIEF